MALTQLIINSLIAGGLYGLVACGFTLIYSTNRFMHFAHGTTAALGAYLLYTFYAQLSIPFFLACLLTLIGTGGIGFVMYIAIYTPLQKRKASSVILLIASLAIYIFIENLILLVYGSDVKGIGYLAVQEGRNILGARMTDLQIATFFITFVLLVLLYILMYKSKLGRTMRAVADNVELAKIAGVDSARVAQIAFILGSVLAGVAGILVGMEQNLDPTMGFTLIIKAFTGSVIGGVTSVPGAILGSYVLAFAENFGIWFLPSSYKDAITFILLFLFLLLRPQGIFGIDRGARE